MPKRNILLLVEEQLEELRRAVDPSWSDERLSECSVEIEFLESEIRRLEGE